MRSVLQYTTYGISEPGFIRNLTDPDAPTRAQRKGTHSPGSCLGLLLTASNRIADKVQHVRHVVCTAIVSPEQVSVEVISMSLNPVDYKIPELRDDGPRASFAWDRLLWPQSIIGLTCPPQ